MGSVTRYVDTKLCLKKKKDLRLQTVSIIEQKGFSSL
jgi:hypothetical protein